MEIALSDRTILSEVKYSNKILPNLASNKSYDDMSSTKIEKTVLNFEDDDKEDTILLHRKRTWKAQQGDFKIDLISC